MIASVQQTPIFPKTDTPRTNEKSKTSQSKLDNIYRKHSTEGSCGLCTYRLVTKLLRRPLCGPCVLARVQERHPYYRQHGRYTGTSLTRNCLRIGPYSGTMPQALQCSWGVGGFLRARHPCMQPSTLHSPPPTRFRVSAQTPHQSSYTRILGDI